MVAVGYDDAELVAAETRKEGVACRLFQAPRHLSQSAVAHCMSEDVIDLLETVQVHANDGELSAAPFASLQRPGNELVEGHPIRQIGQRVVMGEVLDAGLRLHAVGNVFMRRDPSATRHRTIDDMNAAAIRQPDRRVSGLAEHDVLDDTLTILIRIADEQSGGLAMLDQLTQRASRLHDLGRQAVHLKELPVAKNQPPLAVEHEQALRHVLDGGLGLKFLLDQQLFRAFAGRDVDDRIEPSVAA